MEEIKLIPIGKLVVGVHAVRAKVDDESLVDLAASIRRIGIIVPLVVRPDGDKFLIVAGHRRFAAASRVGLENIPCCVYEKGAAAGVEMSLAENLFRTDLTPVEQASAIKDILDNKIADIEEVARMVHRSDHWVHAQLAMLDWSADILEAIHNGKISVSAASNLAVIHEDNYREFLLRNAVEQGATARTTAAWLQAWRASMPQEQAVEQPPVEGSAPVTPALPQAPCICCNTLQRTDALAMVLICTGCVNTIRGVGVQG